MSKTSFKTWLEARMISRGNMDKFSTYDDVESDVFNQEDPSPIGVNAKRFDGLSKLPRDFRDKAKERLMDKSAEMGGPLGGYMSDEDTSVKHAVSRISDYWSGDLSSVRGDVKDLIDILKHHSSPRSAYEMISSLPNPVLAIIKSNVPSLWKQSNYDSSINPARYLSGIKG